MSVTMTVDEARGRIVVARIRWNQARAAWLDDDGSDIPGEAANRWAWVQAQRALEAAEAALAEATAAEGQEKSGVVAVEWGRWRSGPEAASHIGLVFPAI